MPPSGWEEPAGEQEGPGEEAPGPERRGGEGDESCARQILRPHPAPALWTGEPYVTIKAYTAALEDEISLQEGETIEVIHKLLDGWWVVR